MEMNKKHIFNRDDDRRIRYCQKAPEWAEHARFDEQDEPCVMIAEPEKFVGTEKGKNLVQFELTTNGMIGFNYHAP